MYLILPNNKKMILSIIIPMYNVEQYVEDCLESILLQDFEQNEYEIIIVNDSSSDNSLRIVEKYKKLYQQIIIINNEKNLGVSESRNRGLNIAKGDYIYIMDADDFIRPNTLKKIILSMQKESADICYFKFKYVAQSSRFISTDLQINPEEIGSLFTKKNKQDMPSLFTTWTYIYKRDEFSHIRFIPNLSPTEDELFSFQLFVLSKNPINLDFTIYYYRQREGSIMHSNEYSFLYKKTDSFHISTLEIISFLAHYKERINDKEYERYLFLIDSKVFATIFLTIQYRKEKITPLIKKYKELGVFPVKRHNKYEDGNYRTKLLRLIYSNWLLFKAYKFIA